MHDQQVTDEHLEAFITAGCRIASYDLVRFSSGNLSWRVTDDVAIVTAKGAWLGELTREHLAICRVADGTPLNDKVPSVETGLHFGVYRARPGFRVVLHCQSPCATAIACGNPEGYDFSIIPEVPFYVGVPAIVDYSAPGSLELASAVAGAMKEHELVLVRNHGQVTAGKDFDDVIQKAGFFELACEMLVHGRGIKPMSLRDIEALTTRAARERPRI